MAQICVVFSEYMNFKFMSVQLARTWLDLTQIFIFFQKVKPESFPHLRIQNIFEELRSSHRKFGFIVS